MPSATRRNPYVALAVYWAPLIAWAALISVSSGMPVHSVDGVRMTFGVELVPDSYTFVAREFRYHAGAFGVLALLIYRALRATMGRSRGEAFQVVLVLAVGYAFVDELHQAFVPGRDASIIDLGYDILGVAALLLGVRIISMVNDKVGATHRGWHAPTSSARQPTTRS